MIEQIIKIGWQVVEVSFLIVAICVLLSLIIGPDSGYVATVAGNAQRFLQSLPAGVILGGALIVAVYSWAKSR